MNELARINYALKDIAETRAIWRDEKPIADPYMRKRWREFDELTAPKQHLMRGGR